MIYAACPAHTFKSSTGNDACRSCPRDSDTNKMASVQCQCRRSADTPCTRQTAYCSVFIVVHVVVLAVVVVVTSSSILDSA